MRVVTCPVCGSTVNAQVHHCPQCGADQRLSAGDAAADLRPRGILLLGEGPEGSPLSAAASVSTAEFGPMTAAAIGGAVAGFPLASLGLDLGLPPSHAIEKAILSSWSLAVVLALVGIVLLAMRHRARLAGLCFIASALLVTVAAVLLAGHFGEAEKIIYGLSAVASLPLLYAGIVAIRRAPEVAAAALQQGAGDPDRTARRRGAIALALAGLVLTGELFVTSWLLAAVFDEDNGIASDLRTLLLFWFIGVTLAVVGVILLRDSRWPRLAASFLLASCLMGVIGSVAMYAVSDHQLEYYGWRFFVEEHADALGALVAWGLLALPLLLSGLIVMIRPAAFRRSQEASS